MICPERLRLVSEYNQTTRSYADLVRKLTELIDLSLHSEVAVLRRSVRNAWDAAEKARLAYHRHEVDHGCDRADFQPQAGRAAWSRSN